MDVIFSGVGEAFDEARSNTSLIVSHQSSGSLRQILLDCGFNAAHAFWRHAPQPLNLDAVWVSHFHGDHFLGLPLLILRFWDENRRKPLAIVGPAGIQEKVVAAMDLAYPGFLPRIEFPIHFYPVDTSHHLRLAGLDWSFAPNDHSQSCLAVKIAHNGVSLFYSGDGRATPQSENLARDASLVVHEAFTINSLQGGHSTVKDSIAFARRARARTLALVHLNREVRSRQFQLLDSIIQAVDDLTVLLPEAGDRIALQQTPPSRGALPRGLPPAD